MIQRQLQIFALDGVLYELVEDTETGKIILIDERGVRTTCGAHLPQIREAITKLQDIGGAASRRPPSSEFSEFSELLWAGAAAQAWDHYSQINDLEGELQKSKSSTTALLHAANHDLFLLAFKLGAKYEHWQRQSQDTSAPETGR